MQRHSDVSPVTQHHHRARKSIDLSEGPQCDKHHRPPQDRLGEGEECQSSRNVTVADDPSQRRNDEENEHVQRCLAPTPRQNPTTQPRQPNPVLGESRSRPLTRTARFCDSSPKRSQPCPRPTPKPDQEGTVAPQSQPLLTSSTAAAARPCLVDHSFRRGSPRAIEPKVQPSPRSDTIPWSQSAETATSDRLR